MSDEELIAQIRMRFQKDADGVWQAKFGSWRYELSWDDPGPDKSGWWLAWWALDEHERGTAEDGCPIYGEDDGPDWAEVARVVHDRRYE